MQNVSLTIREPLPVFSEYGHVRQQAVSRARKQAIERAMDLEAASSSDIRNALSNELVDSAPADSTSGGSSGLVRPRIESEKVRQIDGGNVMELAVLVSICIPRTLKVPPRRIADPPGNFFDPLSGAATVWYWRSAEGDFEFYDNQGFHPGTGDALKPMTRELVAEWREQEQRRIEKGRQQKEQEFREAQSLTRCDELAANPHDLQRPNTIPGAEYAFLKLNGREAVDACRDALKRNPRDGRISYQLGRALQAQRDLRAAVKSLTVAIQLDHVVAYDNLGWILLGQGKLAEARSMFVKGAAAGDPSCMVSLAGLYEEQARSGSYDAMMTQAIRLYEQAAALGNSVAQRRLVELPAEMRARKEEENRLAQEQARQREMEIERNRRAMELMNHMIGTFSRGIGVR
ncbi:hypothetical protein MWN33_05235 [Starkeya koreensis]|uniref:Tetratricopeptide repeat protein n=1 Tax=Ancylobacter koreensis TaxID=266121 RepID=A0ABT0DJH9_9HYPH|nr:hypothetical protein [Ancylobacter koreensis]MCK0207435.1 hypothetical protein [Ancylobacter koreensis]